MLIVVLLKLKVQEWIGPGNGKPIPSSPARSHASSFHLHTWEHTELEWALPLRSVQNQTGTGTNYPLDHLPHAIPITTLSTEDASEKTSFSLLLLLGLRSKGQRTDRQRTPCQITDVMNFRSRILTYFRGPRPLTYFHGPRLLTSFHRTRSSFFWPLRLLLSLLSSRCGNPLPYTPFQR
jgi:hypothetical protein